MPSPPGLAGLPCPDGVSCRLGGRGTRSAGDGARAASRAETPTNPVNPSQTRQRLGKTSAGRRRRLRVRLAEAPRPRGWPQRAQIMRPARARSAFTAQLPQLGQAMVTPHPPNHAIVTPLPGDGPDASPLRTRMLVLLCVPWRVVAGGAAKQVVTGRAVTRRAVAGGASVARGGGCGGEPASLGLSQPSDGLRGGAH